MRTETSFEPVADVPLAPLTTLGVGGAARWMAVATSPGHVARAYSWARDRQLPVFVLGGGSNVVIADEGFAGLVLRIALTGATFEQQGDTTRVAAGAGELWDGLVASVVARGLAGVECLSGIPGTVGGTPIQNVGAYGQEVSETIDAVSAYDTTCGDLVSIPAANCRFAYRMSRFKAEPGRYVVTEVAYRFQPGAPRVRYPDLQAHLASAGRVRASLDDVRQAVLAVRRTKGMVVDPADPDSRSVGSFFMNPIVPSETLDAIAAAAGEPAPSFPAGPDAVKVPAAWLIERAGYRKGFADDRVAISSKHPLALVNRGGATARDVLRLAVRIKRHVADRFGVTLKPEPIFVGFEDDPGVTYLRS